MSFCTECGFKIEEQIKFCPGCGKGLQPPKEPVESFQRKENVLTNKSSENSNFWKTSAIISVVLLIGIIVSVSNANKNSPSNSSSNRAVSDSATNPTPESGNADGSSSSNSSSDWLSRLNSAGSDIWSQDVVLPLNPPQGFITDYLADDAFDGGGCNLSIFNTEADAKAADDSGLAVNLGFGWYGTDSQTGLGILLTGQDSTNTCLASAQLAIGWGN